MQSQGLGALMPQAAQQMAPQQASPRLTAATNLVSSDAERQILDPRTLALIKYKDAIQAMQAADQMMAAAQPAPTPPTVAERTKLAAEQGIAGLASKLGAGIQQQGNNMQAQQLQQAMSGGLPQLPAPNMAGMAQGGIVGYAQGDLVEGDDPVVGEFADGTPMRQSQYNAMMGRLENADPIIGEMPDGTPMRQSQYDAMMGRLENAGAIDETPEGVERRAQNAALQEAGQQGIADILGASRLDQIEIAPAAQEPVAESRGRGGYGLDEMAIDAFGKIKSFVPGALEGLGGLTFSTEGTNLGRVREIASENDLPFFTKVAAYPTAVVRDLLATQSRIGEDLASGYDLAKEGVYTAAEQVGAGVDLARGEQPAVQPTAQTSTAAQGRPVVPRQVRPAQQGFTPAPESMSGEMREPTPVERLRAAAAENTAQQGEKDAVDALLEEEQQPRAGESASDRDARMRRLIAGLRGFGAQGLGGFAAGAGEEELRQEQEVIADQERKRRAAMETRGLDLEERNITLQDAIRQQQLSQQQRADAEMLQYRYDQLNQRQQEAVDKAVNEETAMLRQALQALDSQIPNLKDGFFSSDLSDAVAQRESLVQQILAARARILEMYSGTQYGPAQTGQAGLAPEDDALVSEYLNR